MSVIDQTEQRRKRTRRGAAAASGGGKRGECERNRSNKQRRKRTRRGAAAASEANESEFDQTEQEVIAMPCTSECERRAQLPEQCTRQAHIEVRRKGRKEGHAAHIECDGRAMTTSTEFEQCSCRAHIEVRRREIGEPAHGPYPHGAGRGLGLLGLLGSLGLLGFIALLGLLGNV